MLYDYKIVHFIRLYCTCRFGTHDALLFLRSVSRNSLVSVGGGVGCYWMDGGTDGGGVVGKC